MINSDIKAVINNYSKLAVAVSGGVDSMALLHWLIDNYGSAKLVVLNVEHGIRGEASKRDTELVKHYCDSKGVECVLYSVDAPKTARDNGYTLEQAARVLRHDIFKQYSYDNGDVPILTAHHAQDQAESVFMHIARGCSLNGLCGMQLFNNHLMRPLIRTTKNEIMEYVHANGVPYVIDETNVDTRFSRNYVRSEVMPMIEQRYPNFRDNLIKLSDRAVETMEFLDRFVPSLEVDTTGAVAVDIAALDKIIAAIAVRKACALLGVSADIESRHYEAIMALQPNESIDLPHNLRAYNERGLVIIEVKKGISAVSYKVGVGDYGFGGGNLIISDSYIEGSKQIDYDKLPDNAVIRTRREGDRIKLNYGAKSVSDFLTDRKVPSRIKDTMPLIASDSTVYAIADMAIDDSIRTDAQSSRVLNIIWDKPCI